MQESTGQPPSEAPLGPGRGLAEERVITEAILSLGLCTQEERLMEVLLTQASQVIPTPHWALARAEAGANGPEVAILAATPTLRARSGDLLMSLRLPLGEGRLSRALLHPKETSLSVGVAEIPTPYRELVPIEGLLGIPLVLE